MILIARRYAKAIFELAEDKQQLRQDVEALLMVFSANKKLLEELSSALLQPKDRQTLFNELTKNLQLTNIWNNTLTLLASKKRVNILHEICNALLNMLLEFSNEVKVKLKVAKPQSQESLNKIIKTIEKALNKKVIIDVEIKPSLIGGFEASGDSIHIDGSVKYNLEKFKSAFSS